MGGVVFLPSLPQKPVTQRSAALAKVAKFDVAGLPGADIADNMEARGYPWARTCASLLRADSQLEIVGALAACWHVFGTSLVPRVAPAQELESSDSLLERCLSGVGHPPGSQRFTTLTGG